MIKVRGITGFGEFSGEKTAWIASAESTAMARWLGWAKYLGIQRGSTPIITSHYSSFVQADANQRNVE